MWIESTDRGTLACELSPWTEALSRTRRICTLYWISEFDLNLVLHLAIHPSPFPPSLPPSLPSPSYSIRRSLYLFLFLSTIVSPSVSACRPASLPPPLPLSLPTTYSANARLRTWRGHKTKHQSTIHNLQTQTSLVLVAKHSHRKFGCQTLTKKF